ncbi:hypothetical protein ZYGR_0AG02930 [Zygosaccharomyces rouxii]|uniref:Uncharacterized protein n=1 Tax=Zygosaccharomyces rouxii TaxID=4956 RepID=A0A1Q3A9B9_ZYGRO|nr:hypothetical protein ZYGR_0AG02930 [Zygosaccharomyces rouxii]
MFRNIVPISLISWPTQVARRNIKMTKRFASIFSQILDGSREGFVAITLGVITTLASITFVSPWEVKTFLPAFGKKEQDTIEPGKEPESEGREI